MKLPTYGGIYNLPTSGGFCDSKPTSLGYHRTPVPVFPVLPPFRLRRQLHLALRRGRGHRAAPGRRQRRRRGRRRRGLRRAEPGPLQRHGGAGALRRILPRGTWWRFQFFEKSLAESCQVLFLWSEMGHKSLFLSIFCPKSPSRGAAAPTARLLRRLRRSRAALGHTPWPLGTLHLGPGDFATSGCSWRYSSLLSPSTPLQTLVWDEQGMKK